jgi:hypothetical protein
MVWRDIFVLIRAEGGAFFKDENGEVEKRRASTA